jgi:hypothetical protein
MRAAAILLAAIGLLIATPAEAKLTYDNDGRTTQTSVGSNDRSRNTRAVRSNREVRRGVVRSHHRHDASAQVSVVGGRPAGCPARYCGCGLSIKLFGRVIPELNLAENWIRRFPRTSPASGMVAARRGHAMELREHVKGEFWLVYDPNSGRGLTRIHVRSISRFAVVNPYATRVAAK